MKQYTIVLINRARWPRFTKADAPAAAAYACEPHTPLRIATRVRGDYHAEILVEYDDGATGGRVACPAPPALCQACGRHKVCPDSPGAVPLGQVLAQFTQLREVHKAQ